MRRHLLIIPLLALAACERQTPSRATDPPRADSTASRSGRTPLARVRTLPMGAAVTVEGVVTVPSGAVDSGFALQEGPRAIYVAADSATRVAAGQMVRVAGRLADVHGLLVVNAASVDTVGRTAPFPAYSIRTKRIGEITESLLVSVKGRITGAVVDDRPYGWKIPINDGSGPLQVFVPTHHAFDPSPYRPGLTLQVEGMSAQYDSTYEVIATRPLQIVQ
ncbi:MAG TPA: hypothetical protein VEX86_03080 [Longimicrobium sp.]|nr:hypothetical protein [Longimicrobium sp.]